MDNAPANAYEGMAITPEPGWLLHTPHGTARCGDGADDYLVRLSDVVRWFMKKRGLPLAVAVRRVLEGITPESFRQMYFLHEQDWARPMWEPSPWEQFAMTPEEQALPYFEGRVRWLIRRLRADWLMPSWEAERFFNDGMPAGEPPEYVKDREPPFDFLDRVGSTAGFSIRMSVAHELWGWGSVATAVALPEAVPSATAAPVTQTQDTAPAIGPQDVSDWPSLVQYRHQLVDVPDKQRPVWSFEHVAILAGRMNEEYRAGRRRGARPRLARELKSATPQGLIGVLERYGYCAQTGEAITGEAKRRAVVFDCLLHGDKEKAA